MLRLSNFRPVGHGKPARVPESLRGAQDTLTPSKGIYMFRTARDRFGPGRVVNNDYCPVIRRSVNDACDFGLGHGKVESPSLGDTMGEGDSGVAFTLLADIFFFQGVLGSGAGRGRRKPDGSTRDTRIAFPANGVGRGEAATGQSMAFVKSPFTPHEWHASVIRAYCPMPVKWFLTLLLLTSSAYRRRFGQCAECFRRDN